MTDVKISEDMNVLGKIFLTVAVLFYGGHINAEESRDLYFIDAHSQIDHNVDGIDVVLKRMLANNVTTTLLSTRGKRNWRDILDWNSKYPTKIAPLIRSKGKHYKNNSAKYYKRVRKQIETGKFIGAAEILVFHAQKGSKAPEVAVDLFDERVSLLLTESISQEWPFVIHIEFSSLHGRERQRYMDELNSLLEQHPKHPFVLIHMGQLFHDQVHELINHHPNIYFLTSHTDPVTVNNSKQPWTKIFSASGHHFKDSWKNLFNAYPDRFIFALDNVWDYHWQGSYDEKMKYWSEALSEMPAKTAELIAHGNAERLWKLK
jgi:predicted TIM-barrel fold metal-dependent hydrolase